MKKRFSIVYYGKMIHTTPISRAILLNLKGKPLLEQFIINVYMGVLQRAATATVYEHCIPITNDGFFAKNMKEILARLQEMFPECSITHTLLSRGSDGRLYDIAKADNSVLPLMESVLDNSYIVVDWT